MRNAVGTIVALLLCCAPPALAAAGAEGEPLASVNGHRITTRDLDSHLQMLRPLAAHAADSAVTTAMELEQVERQRRKDGLAELVERRLLYDVARDEYLGGEQARQLLDQAAEEELRKFEERVGSMLKARRVLSQVGLTTEQYKELQIQNLLAAKLLWDKVFSRVHVAPAEARQYYEEHLADFERPRTVVFRQMLFVVVEPGEEQAQRERAEAALARLREGEDFTLVAERSSADAGAEPGDPLRIGVPDTMPDWLPPAVRGLEPGATSEVRRLSAGYSIGRLLEVRPTGPQPFGEVQPAIKEGLMQFKRAAAQAEYLDELRADARIEYYPAARELMQE